MPAPPPMSIAATLAAHRNKANIQQKYQPSPGQHSNPLGGGSSNSPPPSTSSDAPTRRPLAPVARIAETGPRKSLHSNPEKKQQPTPSSSFPQKEASLSSSSPLPIYHDQTISDATGSQVNACLYNTTGEYMLTGGADRTVRLWNPETGYCIKTYEAHGWEVLDLAVSPENGKFASCGGDRTVFLWDVISGMTIRRFSGHTQRINAVEFNEDGTVLASGSYDATVRLWDCRSHLRAPIQILEEFKDSVTSIQIQGSDLLVGCVDGSIRIYDIRMGTVTTDQIFEPITSVSFSKDGNCVLASSLDNTIRLMDRANGGLLNAYKGHKNDKYKIRSCLSNTDAHVLSGSEDGGIYIWDLIEGQVVHRIEAHSKIVTSITYHPTQDRMCSASVDGSIKSWTSEPPPAI